MKMRALFLVILTLFCFLQSGCWDYEEYEDLIQVSALGFDFDKKSNNISVTILYIPTSKGLQSGGQSSGGSPPPKKENVHSVTAKSVYEGLEKIQEVLPKKLFYGYLKVLVIGKEAAKYKLMDLMELYDRTPVGRNSTYIAITAGKAEDTLSTFDAASITSSSEKIYNLIDLANQIGSSYTVTIQDFISRLAISGIEATAPRVLTVSNIPKPNAAGGVDENIKYDLGRPGDHNINGLAAFKGDKLVGWLNEQESLGFGWITGKSVIAYKVTEIGQNANTDIQNNFRISSSNGKIKVTISNGQPHFQVNVNVVAELRKYYSHQGSSFLGPKILTDIEKNLSDSIRTDIEAALRKGQKKLKSDVFGFGFALFREDVNLWRSKYDKKWDKIFPNIPIKVTVKAKIKNTGTNIRRFYVK